MSKGISTFRDINKIRPAIEYLMKYGSDNFKLQPHEAVPNIIAVCVSAVASMVVPSNTKHEDVGVIAKALIIEFLNEADMEGRRDGVPN